MAVSLFKKSATQPEAKQGPARRALRNAQELLPRLNAEVSRWGAQEREETAHIEAHRAAKAAAFASDSIDPDISEALARVATLARRAQRAVQALPEIVAQRNAAERERALVGAQFPGLVHAAWLEALGDAAPDYFEKFLAFRAVLKRVIATAKKADEAAQAVRDAGGRVDFVGWPRFREYAALWIPLHPAFDQPVPGIDDAAVSLELNAEAERLEQELFAP
jgi:hypothetical protein